jgi:hypothetical protein
VEKKERKKLNYNIYLTQIYTKGKYLKIGGTIILLGAVG